MSARTGPVSPSVAAGDLITYRRQHLAAAYRRVADAATHAAQVLCDPELGLDDQESAAASVDGRLLSVREGQVLLRATRTGVGRASVQARVT